MMKPCDSSDSAMDDGFHHRPSQQSPSYDIGPDEDRHYDSDFTRLDTLVDFDESGNPIFEPIYVRSRPGGIFEEPIDETPCDDALYHEINRLKTFEGNWLDSYNVLPNDLARNGLFYLGPGDRVKCVFCQKTLWHWEQGDTVEEEHRKHYPSCPFVNGQCKHLNVPISASENMKVSLGLNMKTADQVTTVSVPGMQRFPDRLKTYQSCSNISLRPDALAEAGFFYVGPHDRLKCFTCGNMVSNWELGDDPWVEHAKWSPDCPYVHRIKGSEFVNQIKRKEMDGKSGAASSAFHELIDDEERKAQVPYDGGKGKLGMNSAASHINGKLTQPRSDEAKVHMQEHGIHFDNDLSNPAVKAVREIYDIPLEEIIRRLHQIRITKGSGYKLTVDDFIDLAQ